MDKYADFADQSVHTFYADQVSEMYRIAELNKRRKRYRICGHMSPDDELQEMYICAKAEGYIAPQKHPNTAETHFILDGSVATILFDDVGNILDVIILDKKKGALSCRVGKGIYHMDFFLTPWASFLEFRAGPFTAESNVNAPWAPDENNTEEVNMFMERIKHSVDSTRGKKT